MVASLVLSLFGVNTWLLFVSPQQNTLIPAPVVSMPPNAVRRAASQQATVPGRGGAMGHCPTEIAARTAGCTEAEGVFATGFWGEAFFFFQLVGENRVYWFHS